MKSGSRVAPSLSIILIDLSWHSPSYERIFQAEEMLWPGKKARREGEKAEAGQGRADAGGRRGSGRDFEK